MLRLNKVLYELTSWNILTFLIVGITIIPAMNILLGAFTPETENWKHIQQYLLTDYLVNTAVLLIFSSLFASLIGVSP